VFEKVIIGVDGRPGGRDAIALAQQLAAPGARMTLAHVYASKAMLARGGGLAVSADRKYSEHMLKREREAASLQAELVAVIGPGVGHAMHELAEGRHADLLVVGSCHRGSVGRVLVGDDALATLHGAPCAVAITPAGYASQASELATVAVGDDGSPEGALALRAAIDLAAHFGGAVSAVSVIPLQSLPSDTSISADWTNTTERLIHDERERLARIPGVDGDAVYGEPGEELVRLSGNADLMVVGSRGFGPLGRLMNGSTSNYLARHVLCPLLVLPRPGSASPSP